MRPRKSQNMMIKVPGKPKSTYALTEQMIKIADSKKKIEKMKEERELQKSMMEVWE